MQFLRGGTCVAVDGLTKSITTIMGDMNSQTNVPLPRRTSTMSQSLVKNLIHLVYSTKHRKTWLSEDVRDRLFAYQAGIFKQWESPAIVIGGVEDHVHALFNLSKNYALKKVVEEIKKGSSKWMKTSQGASNKNFQWQNGYAGFSVSQSNVEQVKKYIEQQEDHHRKMTFQEELRGLFLRHGIEFDERYMWD
jgi:putative transposase